MSLQPSHNYFVSSEELSYLLDQLGAEVVPGLQKNYLSLLTDQSHKDTAVSIIEHSLEARSYLTYDAENRTLIEPTLAAALQLMIRCAYLLVMVKVEQPNSPPDLTICFISPPIVISELFPAPFVHSLAVFDTQPDFASDLMLMIPPSRGCTVAIDLTLDRATWNDIFRSPTSLNKRDANIQAELMTVMEIVNQTTFAIEVSLSSLLESTIVTKSLSIRCTPEFCLFTIDSNDGLTGDNVRVRTVSRNELQNLLQDWLAPVQITDKAIA